MAPCLILLSSSALNNPAKKSLYSSFCLEKPPLPSTKIREPGLGLVLFFSNS